MHYTLRTNRMGPVLAAEGTVQYTPCTIRYALIAWDLYSLLKFLQLEPWSSYGWWKRVIQVQ
jgi:hypothetical protein